MNTQKDKNFIAEIMAGLNACRGDLNLSEQDMLQKISETHHLIVNHWVNKIISDSKEITLDDYNNLSDLLIELVDLTAVTLIRSYSKDSTDAPYKIPHDKLLRMKEKLTKVLMLKQKDSTLQELLLSSINIAYMTPLLKATKNREEKLNN